MSQGRLIKRTVTEELYDDRACPAPGIDDDDDAVADDEDLDEGVEATRSFRGRSHEGASTSGADTAGSDDSNLVPS